MAQDYVINPASEKVELVNELRTLVVETKVALLTDYRGLSVAELTDLRRKLRGVDAEFRVVKNTLFRRAADGLMPTSDMDMHLSGPTAIGFAKSDPVGAAKVLLDFVKDHKTLSLKVGVMDGRMLDAAQVDALSKIPPREVLISQMLGSLQSPIAGLMGTLSVILPNFIFTLQSVVDKGSSEAPSALVETISRRAHGTMFHIHSSDNKEFECTEIYATSVQSEEVIIAGDVYHDFFSFWWATIQSADDFLDAARSFVRMLFASQKNCIKLTERKEHSGIILITDVGICDPLDLKQIEKVNFDDLQKMADSMLLSSSKIQHIRIATSEADIWYDISPIKAQTYRAGVLSHCSLVDEIGMFFVLTTANSHAKSYASNLITRCTKIFDERI